MTPEQQAEINATMDAEIAKFILALPGFINRTLEDATMNLLGLERDRWNREIKVDHCNGRPSAIIALIQNRSQALLEQECGPHIEAAIRKICTKPAVLTSIKREAQERFERYFREAIMNGVAALASEKAQQYLDEYFTSQLQPLVRNTDCCDPASYPGALGEILLEEKAKELVK